MLNNYITEYISFLHNSKYSQIFMDISIYLSNTFDTKRATFFVIFLCCFLYATNKKYFAKFIFANYILSMSIIYILKSIINKPRSPMIITLEHSSAFPSGHTAVAMITSLLMIYYSRFIVNKLFKYISIIFAIILTPSMIFARIYLYAHDIYDCLASVLIVSIVFLIVYKNRKIVSRVLSK